MNHKVILKEDFLLPFKLCNIKNKQNHNHLMVKFFAHFHFKHFKNIFTSRNDARCSHELPNINDVFFLCSKLAFLDLTDTSHQKE